MIPNNQHLLHLLQGLKPYSTRFNKKNHNLLNMQNRKCNLGCLKPLVDNVIYFFIIYTTVYNSYITLLRINALNLIKLKH